MNASTQQVAEGLARLAVKELEVQGASGSLAARLYSFGPASPRRDTLIVFFHGGGFVKGSLDETDHFLRRLAWSDPAHVILSSTYTLATVSPFPAAVEDAHAVLLWAKKNKTKVAWNGKRMLVAGIEAGANLAAVCALMSRDRGGPPIDGQVLIMPMIDPALSTGSMREVPRCPNKARELELLSGTCAAGYRGYLPHPADRAHPYASPLQSSRLRNLPPALILTTEDDPLRDEAEQYGEKLSANGVATTVRRMPAASLAEPGGRNECAACDFTLSEMTHFMHAVDAAKVKPAT
ncbi:MAG: alpha/beta hydrolase [Telluria sp.]